MSAPKRRNRISGQWSARLIEMLESPAYRALSRSAHQVISRIEIEIGRHGGNDNGRLPVTTEDFIEYGMNRASVAPAIREAEALGFIRVTERGRGGNAEYRKPNLFHLTFAHGRDSRAEPPTHDWRRIKTMEDAERIAKAARASKNARAVVSGRLNWEHRKNKNRYRKLVPVPVLETHTENAKSPVLETSTTGSVQKPILLSIVGVGDGRQAASPLPVSPAIDLPCFLPRRVLS
jgi:hypothetical protein